MWALIGEKKKAFICCCLKNHCYFIDNKYSSLIYTCILFLKPNQAGLLGLFWLSEEV